MLRILDAQPARPEASKTANVQRPNETTRLDGVSVLVVDRDSHGARTLADELARAGCRVETCEGGRRLERLLEAEDWDAVLADLDSAPLEELAAIEATERAPALLLLAAFGSIHEAVEAMRAGAADYISKPVSGDRVLMALERAMERRRLLAEKRRLRADLGERFELDQLESRDPELLKVFETVRAVADTRATILVEGESGTGKTVLARSIHRMSSRARGPFVEVNCGALPEGLLETELFGHVRGAFTGAIKDRPGKFEAADGGTIFLDEIACAPHDLQVKLLRVLQDRELERVGDTRTRKVDVRVIAATNADLRAAVRAGRFREDLYYRIHVVRLVLPPLRERPGDVLLLAERFLARLANDYGRPALRFHPDCFEVLASHTWPGNVRELENGIERALLLSKGPEILPQDLPCEPRGRALAAALVEAGPTPRSLREALEDSERRILLEALQRNGGRRLETARMLGVNRTTLFNKMRKYELMDLEFGDEAERLSG